MFKKLFNLLGVDIIGPISRRMGTMAGAFVIGLDVAANMVPQVEAAVALLVGVAIDLVLAKVYTVSLYQKPPPVKRVVK